MIVASLQRTDTGLTAGEFPAGTPQVVTGPEHTLRVWNSTAGTVAARGALTVVLEGDFHNVESLAATAGLPPHECRARPAEALVAAASAAGPRAFDGLRGTFWLALADLDTGSVVLHGDLLGLRIVRYTAVPGGWAWSEDLPPLIAWNGRRAIERAVLPAVLNYRRVLGRRTLIEGVSEVPPLCEVVLGERDELRRWDALAFVPEPATEPLAVWVQRLDDALLEHCVAARARHDRVAVPLSGGLDSALLVAIARKAGFTKVLAYSVELEASANEELSRARRVAKYLGVEHRIVRVTDAMIAARADSLMRRLQIMPYNHSDFVFDPLLEAAAGETGAMLYGEGADTALGPVAGLQVDNVGRKRRGIAWLPRSAQLLAASALRPVRMPLARRLEHLLRYTQVERAMRVFMLESRTPLSSLLPGAPLEPPEVDDSVGAFDPSVDGPIEWYQRRTLIGQCRNHWYAAQRMAQAVGLAVELPFVADPALNVGRRLPTAYKRDGDLDKPIVRALAKRYLPEGYGDLPKLGFPVPTRRWLTGALKPWVDAARRPDARVWSFLDRDAFERLVWPDDLEQVWTVATLERFIRLFLDPVDA